MKIRDASRATTRVTSWSAYWAPSAMVLAMALGGVAAYAQDAGTSAQAPGTLGDIVITAQRRSESAQNVPIAVTALSSSTMSAMGAADTQSLSGKVPSLTIANFGSQNYFLRGIGTTGTSINQEQSVATYVDGVYVFSTWATSVPLGAVERTEVLKGPQGTLFGRNTTGGVIQVVTRDPLAQEQTIEGSVGYGNYDTTTATFFGSTHTENTGVSLAVDYSRQGEGYGHNTTLNQDEMWFDHLSAQLKGVVELGVTTKVTGMLWWENREWSGYNNRVVPGTRGLDGVVSALPDYTFNANWPDHEEAESFLGYVRLDQDVGFANLVGIVSYRTLDDVFKLDQDTTPLPVVDATLVQPLTNQSYEVQLQSKASSPVTWLVGLYYFKSRAEMNPITIAGLAAGGGNINFFQAQETDSKAIFGQVTVPLGERTNVTFGARYTDETAENPPSFFTTRLPSGNYLVLGTNASQSVDSSGWTGRLAIDHHLTSDLMVYASYNRGLKSGGFSLVTPVNLPAYNPEQLDAYEIGFKSQWFGHRLRLNGAFYFYDFSNIQAQSISAGSVQTVNAAGAEMKGIDLDAEALITDNFNVFGSLGLLDGEYTDWKNAPFYYLNTDPRCNAATTITAGTVCGPTSGGAAIYRADATGKATVYSPEVTAALGGTYSIPTSMGKFSITGFAQYVSQQFVGPTNELDIPAHTIVNGSLAWLSPNEHFGVTIWGRNIFDDDTRGNALEQTVGFLEYQAIPATYGVTLSARY